jgi:hypothetical protein
MTGKANTVFWIGLILIGLNFWISGQSTGLWKSLTSGSSGLKSVGTGGAAGRSPYKPTIPGKCSAGFVWNSQLNACVPKIGIEH